MTNLFTPLTKESTPAEVLSAFLTEIDAGRWPCVHPGGCAYRGPKGNACAIGMFLPEDVAAKLDVRGENLAAVEVECVVRPYLPEWMHNIALRIQRAHDRVHHVPERLKQLRDDLPRLLGVEPADVTSH